MTRCPACGSTDLRLTADIRSVPVHVGLLWPTAEEAETCPKGDMHLMYCRDCGFLHNSAFDETLIDYGLSYDNALHFSQVFRSYEESLANELISRYDLKGKQIVEIGCGSAHFLSLLCELGDNRGTGFDPSHDPDYLDPNAAGRVTVRQEYFTADSEVATPDLICARHLLEHIAQPRDFLKSLREAVGDKGTILYFEVPNALLALKDLSIWDLIYEHCGYYTIDSLTQVFGSNGFEVLRAHEAYGGQFLAIEARVAGDPVGVADARPDASVEVLVEEFREQFITTRARWEEQLRQFTADGKRVIVWGAGGKGVSFMNFLSAAQGVHALVDINPRKQGLFLAGSGHEILAPEELPKHRPDVVLVMNPLYLGEIGETLRELGLGEVQIESV